MSYIVIRNGQRIETEDLNIRPVPKKRRKSFRAQWVRITPRWIEILRHAKHKGTYQLALVILVEAFRQKHCGSEIVLSSIVTRMSRNTRRKATKELVELGLIKTDQKGRESPRVSHIYY
jgi:Fic family protein